MGMLGAFVLGGCSVKEDRETCPMWLYSDMGHLQPYSMAARTIVRHDAGMFGEKVVFRNDRTVFEWPVVKGDITVASYCGIEDRYVQGHHIMVPAGERVPAFRGSSLRANCYGESVYVVAEDNRQSARVNLQVSMPDGDKYPYELALEGDICGMDLLSLSPVEGEFGHNLGLDAYNCGVFQILRQSESSFLTLHVSDRGKVMDSIPLGEMVRETGYDWQADDLKDINILLDHGSLLITVNVGEWGHDEGAEYEFIF